MNTNPTEISSMEPKLSAAPKAPVAVRLKKQPPSPICAEVVDAFKSSGLILAERISFNPDIDRKNLLWIDEIFLKEALTDLLDNAIKNSDENEIIVVSIGISGMHFCRLTISYIHKTSGNEFRSKYFEKPYYYSERTKEIISQHQASVNVLKNGPKVTIEVSFT